MIDSTGGKAHDRVDLAVVAPSFGSFWAFCGRTQLQDRRDHGRYVPPVAGDLPVQSWFAYCRLSSVVGVTLGIDRLIGRRAAPEFGSSISPAASTASKSLPFNDLRAFRARVPPVVLGAGDEPGRAVVRDDSAVLLERPATTRAAPGSADMSTDALSRNQRPSAAAPGRWPTTRMAGRPHVLLLGARRGHPDGVVDRPRPPRRTGRARDTDSPAASADVQPAGRSALDRRSNIAPDPAAQEPSPCGWASNSSQTVQAALSSARRDGRRRRSGRPRPGASAGIG